MEAHLPKGGERGVDSGSIPPSTRRLMTIHRPQGYGEDEFYPRCPVMNNYKALTTVFRSPARGEACPGGLVVQCWKDAPAFRFYVLSECAGLLSGSFWLVALPWLAVQLSGNPASFGATVLLSGAGRMGLVLLGGLLADRISPHTLLRIAATGRALLFMVLAAGGLHSLASVYACALAWGILDAIGLPARGVLLPRLVPDGDLPAANALLSGIEKLWGALGPALAGGVIASVSAARSLAGVAVTLLASGALAVAALVCLEQFRLGGRATTSRPIEARRLVSLTKFPQQLCESVWQPLRTIWPDKGLRAAVCAVVGVNILTAGPLAIGLPTLVVQRFGNHAWLLGLLSSIVAAGGLLGSLVSIRYPMEQGLHASRRSLALVTLCSLGLGIVGVALAGDVAGLAVAAFALGALTGYLTLGGVTHLQRNAPPECLGRLMGLLNLK